MKESSNTSSSSHNIYALILALSLVPLAGDAQAKFVAGMNARQLSQEVKVWLKSGNSLDAIAKEAHDAGLNSGHVASSLIESGQNPAAVVAALIKIDPNAARLITVAALTKKPAQASAITAAAISAAPQQSRAIILEALTVPDVNPSDVLAATASGGSRDK